MNIYDKRLLSIGSDLEKISDVDRVRRALRGHEKQFREAFTAFVRQARSQAVVDQVLNFVRNGRVQDALDLVENQVLRLGATIPKVFQDAGEKQMATLARRVGSGSTVATAFDVTNPRAVQLMQRNRLQFVREFTRRQRDATRTALVEAVRDGAGPRATARAFRDSIGLTQAQRASVRSYQDALVRGSRDVLGRELRDRRFDRTVSRTLDEGDVLTSAQVERMTTRYRQNLLIHRSETLARTEMLRVGSQARQEALTQTIEQTGIDQNNVVRIWRATLDDRTRDTHAAMDGQEAGLDEPFVSPSGAQLMYPGDPAAPPGEVVNCLLPGSVFEAPDLVGLARGVFNGEAITIVTSSGRNLAVTVNHPILTDRGWCPAGQLEEGTQLVCHTRRVDNLSSSVADTKDMPPTVEDLYESIPRSFIIGEGLTMNFHGDVIDRDVEVKLLAGRLLSMSHTNRSEMLRQLPFRFSDVGLSKVSGLCSFRSSLERILITSPCVVGPSDLRISTLFAHLAPFKDLSFVSSSEFDAETSKSGDGTSVSYAEAFSELLRSETRLVELDEVVRVFRYKFFGHVYSPQTVSGLYLAGQGIVNHNCRCVVLTEIRDAGQPSGDPEAIGVPRPGTKKHEVFEVLRTSGIEAALRRAKELGVRSPRVRRWNREWGEAGLLTREPPRTPTPTSISAEEKVLLDTARKEADDLGFDFNRVSLGERGRTFRIGNETYKYAGAYYPAEHRIEVFPGAATTSNLPGLMAHEVMHGKWKLFSDRIRRELNEINRDPRPTTEVMSPDGKLKTEMFRRRWPAYAARTEMLEGDFLKRLIERDGVTEYSKAYWREYNRGKGALHTAINETLAEMNRLNRATGIIPGGPEWSQLYRTVGKLAT